jgi:hypothetical protein
VAFRSEMRFASAQAQNSCVRALIPVTGIGLPRLNVQKPTVCLPIRKRRLSWHLANCKRV